LNTCASEQAVALDGDQEAATRQKKNQRLLKPRPRTPIRKRLRLRTSRRLRPLPRFGFATCESQFSELNAVPERPTIHDRAGYWEQDRNGSRIYLFTGGGLRKATKDYEFGRVLKALDDAKAFSDKGEGGERAKNRRTPDGQTKLYHIDPEKLVL